MVRHLFNLPERSLFNRKIPKNKFYEKLKANTKLKDMFVDEIDYILWKYKLSKETVNLDSTEEVQEIQVFEIHLKQRELSDEILENIDKSIPYPILHVLIYEDEVKLSIAYKQRNQNNENKFVVNRYYETEWMQIAELQFNILSGFNLQDVYENIIRSLMPTGNVKEDENLNESIEKQAKIEKLEKECSKLEAKIRNEKQINRKVELNIELQKKKKELTSLGSV